MRLRSSGAGATALVAVFFLPIVVGEVTKPPEDPPPTERSLKVRLVGAEKDEGEQAQLRVAAAGSPPATAVRLTDDGGQHAVRGKVSRSGCADVPLRRLPGPTATQQWCITLAGLDDGRQVTGVLTGAKTKLSLTVARRASFVPWPLVVLIAGLAGGFVALLLPPWLRRKVRSGLLDQLLSENERARTPERVDGLRDWVKDRRAVGSSDDALLPLIAGVVERGPSAGRRARRALLDALRIGSLPPTHRFVAAARHRAKEPHKREDFLSDEGQLHEVHPLRDWVTALAQLERQLDEIKLAQSEIEVWLKEQCRDEPNAALETALSTWESVDKPSETDGVDSALDQVQQAIAQARSRDECRQELEIRFATAMPATTRNLLAPPPTEPMDLHPHEPPSAPPPSRLQLLRAITALVLVVVAVWTVVTLHQTVYEPKDAFGSLVDYVALWTAALGSGAAAAMVTLLAPWNPHEPASE